MFYVYPPTNMCNEQKIIKNKSTNDNENDDSLLLSRIGGWAYILKSKKDHKLYIGSTDDLRKRLKQHNQGKVVSTKLHVPFELIYYEAYKSENEN
ncbi:MAG: GIY-YIG nuclease family protein [Patescibacteria group bacterium]